MAVGSVATLTIEVEAIEAGSTLNIAQVTDSDQTDPDSTPNNSNPNEDDQDESSVTISEPNTPLIDLELDKAANKASVNVGETFIYTITVTNEGPDAATGVAVFDNLPTSVQFVSASANMGTYSEGTDVWNIGNLPVGGIATLTINVKATTLVMLKT
ncbi:MAG: DUF11 domain-containing protein [Sphingobacteriales bacterium]|nr:DUF11 domain-containing protein [Sphingobacteriales bacterium]